MPKSYSLGQIEPVPADAARFKSDSQEGVSLDTAPNGQVVAPFQNDNTLSGRENSAYQVEDQNNGNLTPPPRYEDTVIPMNKEKEAANDIDPWDLVMPQDTGKPWKEMSIMEKMLGIGLGIFKLALALALLYLFICSIDLMGSSFELLAGRTAGEAFQSEVMQNPLTGLCLGITITVLLQSSSTATSIVVTMVGASILTVEQGIYIIMGANIGTCVTSSIVALTQVAEKNVFRRAFAGSMVLYMFNLLTCVILLPVEMATGYLYHLTLAIVESIDVESDDNPDNPQFLKVITQPLIKKIIDVDDDVINAVAAEDFYMKRPLTKYLCEEEDYEVLYRDYPLGTIVENDHYFLDVKEDRTHPNIFATNEEISNVTLSNGTTVTRFQFEVPSFTEGNSTDTCGHWFVGSGLPDEYTPLADYPYMNLTDAGVGGILLVFSIIMLCTCLIGLVKVLTSLLKGTILKIVRKVINANFPGGKIGEELAGYTAIIAGAILTVLVQSSSVFTSALNPLAGMGIVDFTRVYPLSIGACLGTTITSVLAAFTNDPDTIRNALQCAFAHLFFNITGMLFFYPIPKLRQLPCYLSKKLANVTADYKWFAVVILLMNFLILPLLVLGLSIPGWWLLAIVAIPVVAFLIFIVIINTLQIRCPSKLPLKLQSWGWCPIWLHSLEPYDKCLRKLCPCKVCQEDIAKVEHIDDKCIKDNIPMTVLNGNLVDKNSDNDLTRN